MEAEEEEGEEEGEEGGGGRGRLGAEEEGEAAQGALEEVGGVGVAAELHEGALLGADVETLSVLGIWTQRWVRVIGR